MEIDSHHSVRPRRHNEVGHELGPDGHPGLVLPVLAPISGIRNDRGNPGRRSPLRRIDQQQQLQSIVPGRRCGLDDEHIPPPDVPVDADKDLSVGEIPDGGSIRRFSDEPRDLLGQGAVRPPGEEEKWAPLIGVVHGTLPLSSSAVTARQSREDPPNRQLVMKISKRRAGDVSRPLSSGGKGLYSDWESPSPVSGRIDRASGEEAGHSRPGKGGRTPRLPPRSKTGSGREPV